MSILTYPRSIWTPPTFFARQRNAAGQRIRVDGARMNDTECCCTEVISCPNCTGGEGPGSVSVTISGSSNISAPPAPCGDSQNCSAWDGTYVLDFVADLGVLCLWRLALPATEGYCTGGGVTLYKRAILFELADIGIMRVTANRVDTFGDTSGFGANEHSWAGSWTNPSDCFAIDETLATNVPPAISIACNGGTAHVTSL